MTLMDAIKSGRPFKRKNETAWRDQKEVNVEALLAEDWEVQSLRHEDIRVAGDFEQMPAWARGKKIRFIVEEIDDPKEPTRQTDQGAIHVPMVGMP